MELKSANRYINICKNQSLPSKYLSQICLDHVKDLTRYDMIGAAKKLFVQYLVLISIKPVISFV